MTASGSAAIARRQVLERCKHLTEDHLRYMQKWGVIRPTRAHGDTFYAFPDMAVIRHADGELGDGVSFRAVLRGLLASREGQLAFDFRSEATPAKILKLTRPETPPLDALMGAEPSSRDGSAEQYFASGSTLDNGDPDDFDGAVAAYRRALEIDPYLAPALINLANIHYARHEVAEAQALYERAIAIDATVFEAHFNLGNVFHDLGRYPQAQASYREALRLNPGYADAHFYLAVTLEKCGQSGQARPHWHAYRRLAPDGEWVHLAREFCD